MRAIVATAPVLRVVKGREKDSELGIEFWGRDCLQGCSQRRGCCQGGKGGVARARSREPASSFEKEEVTTGVRDKTGG